MKSKKHVPYMWTAFNWCFTFLSNILHHSLAMVFQMKVSFTTEEAFEIGLINKVLSVQKKLDNLIRETERFTKYKYCTIQ